MLPRTKPELYDWNDTTLGDGPRRTLGGAVGAMLLLAAMLFVVAYPRASLAAVAAGCLVRCAQYGYRAVRRRRAAGRARRFRVPLVGVRVAI